MYDSIISQILANPVGGTVDLTGGPLPTTGYFVGGAAGDAIVFDPKVAGALDCDRLARFLRWAPSEFIGWWTDEVTGLVWIDCSDWYGNRRVARGVTTKRSEIAFWDIGNSVEVRVA